MFSVKALFSKKRSGLTGLLGMVLLALLLCQWTPCPAEDLEAKASEVPAGDNMIRITADRLVTDTQSHNAEFIGNVHVLRNDMQGLLLAEIETRLLPALGLIEALDEHTQR